MLSYAIASIVIVLAALAVLWRPIMHGEVFLPLELLAHMPPWSYSYERTPLHNTINSDLILEYYPRRRLALQMFRAGELPLWNPYVMAGMPLLADGYSALLYPGGLLFLLLPLDRAFGWYALLHLLLAGIGTFWAARGFGLRLLPALLAAVTYMGCGFTLSWLAFPDFSPVIAWLPVALGAVERYERAVAAHWQAAARAGVPNQQHFWRRAQFGYALLAAVALACCVLCQLQLAFIAGSTVAGYWLLRRSLAAPRRLGGAAETLAGVAALALLLSAAQWLPTGALVSQSQRAGSTDQVIGGSLGAAGLLKFVAPAMFGRPVGTPTWGPPTVDQLYPYVGLLALALVPIGVWRTRTPAAAALTVVAVGTLALAIAPTALVSGIPLLNQLPAVYRWTMATSLALALLAGFGLQALLPTAETQPIETRGSPWPRRVAWASGLLALVGFGAVLLGDLQLLTPASKYGQYITLLRPSVRASLVFVGAGTLALGLLVLSRRRAPWFAQSAGVIVLLLVAADLAWYGLPFQSSADPQTLFRPTADLEAALGAGTARNALSAELLYPPTRTSALLARSPGLYRIFAGDYPSHQPNTMSVFGAQDVRGYASLFPRTYLRFARRWEGKTSDAAGWSQVYLTNAHRSRALLDLMNVQYIFFNPNSENERLYPGLELVERTDEGSVYRNPSALPRAFLVHQAEQLANDEELLRRLTAPGFQPGQTALMTAAPPTLAPPTQAEPLPIMTRYTALRVEIQVRASSPALLVLSDTYDSSWQATLDGIPTPVYTVNSVLRGVAIPAGEHRVVFRYRPLPFYIGAALSICGIVVLLGGVVSLRGDTTRTSPDHM
ncbi:MAG: YfhO family protein [Roseiflexaceae bacterium]|nr:YfhO family protein [Roseiflexaceae bacterium]